MEFDHLLSLTATVIVTWAPKVAGSLAVLFFGWVFAKWATRFVRTALGRTDVDPVLVPFLAGVVNVGLIVLVGIAAVGVLGVSTASFVAVLGAAGLAIALAFQGTFSNFAAGVMLLTFRPFKLGDFVEVGGEAGTVKEIGVFSCVMATGDNVEIRVPNSNVFGHTIRNYSANDTRRIDLAVGVSYDDDLGVAVRTCQDVLAADPRVLSDPPAVVAVHELGDSSVNLVVRPWVKKEDYWAARWDLTRALKEQLEAAGCSLPYPQRDVHLHQTA
ncbi:MAG: mechanosensitive ion channel family protein [Gemmatimonadota bacterium]